MSAGRLVGSWRHGWCAPHPATSQEAGLRCQQKRKFRATTASRHALPIAPNLLDRQFAVAAPNQAWVADITSITSIATDEGWLYLASVKDLFSGELVGHVVERLTQPLVAQALARAVASLRPGTGLIHRAAGNESRSSSNVVLPDGRTDIPLMLIEVVLRTQEQDHHAIIEWLDRIRTFVASIM